MSPRFMARTPLAASTQELWDWHLRPGALERLLPPWERIRVVARSGPLGEGATVTLRVGLGPVSLRWEALHRDFVQGHEFKDEQLRGPFAHWLHTHRFSAGEGGQGAAGSVLEDRIDLALPGPRWAARWGERSVRSRLARQFRFRHAVTRRDLERHHAAGLERWCVGISGSSGLVGSALTAFLAAGGHEVRAIRRSGHRGTEFELGAIEGVDALVHLAGENVGAGRWTAARRARIRESRVEGTRQIATAVAALPRPPRVLVVASAIGFYGDRGDEWLDEGSGRGSGFLAETCEAWERASAPAEAAGVRVVRLRIGVVLTPSGGALARMLLPFRLGLGGRMGSGRQFMSWVSLEDLIGVIHRSLFDDRLLGSVNAVAPEPVTQADFCRTLADVLRRPARFPVPAWVIRRALGEMGQELLLASARVRPRRLEQIEFPFAHQRVETALRSCLGRERDTGPTEIGWED